MNPPLFNFILYCEHSASYRFLYPFVKQMQLEFPCKLFLLYNELSLEDISTIDNNDSSLSISSKDADEVMIFVYGQLLTDLPIYLFWGGGMQQNNDLFKLLLRHAERLIIDSQTFNIFESRSKKIDSILDQKQIEVVDLSWIRLQGWRKLFFQLYSSELPINQLQHVEEITIQYNDVTEKKSFSTLLPSFFLISWIASQLNWTLDTKYNSNSPEHIAYKNTGGICNISLQATSNPLLENGSMIQINLKSEHNQLVEITRKKGQTAAIVILNNDRCSIPFNLPLQNEKICKTFFRSLLYHFEKDHYLKALKLLPHIENEPFLESKGPFYG